MAKKSILLALLDKFEADISAAFKAAIANIKSDAILSEIIKAIEAGDINQAVKFTGISEAAMRPLQQALERSFEIGATTIAAEFKRPVGNAVFRVDIRNSRAEAYLRDYSSQLVTRTTDAQRDLVRNVINQGMVDGINPRNISLDIVGRIDPITGRRTGGIIGLDDQKALYVRNMRDDLYNLDERYFTRARRDERFDSTVRKAIDSGTPLSSDQIDNLTTRYSNSLLELRGTTIARTEALTSLNKSQQEAIQQLVENGGVDQNQVKRIWDSAGNDGRTRDSHLEMDGQEVGLNEPFITPDGEKLMHPGDTSLGASAEETINCRCRVRLKIDWIKNVRGTL